MRKLFFGLILPLILLTGCWDQHMIKDARLVYAASFDKGENENVRGTAVIRGFVASGGESGGGTPQNERVVAEGKNVRNVRMNLDRALSGTFTAAKTRVFLYSEDLSKEGLYPYMDIFYREATSSLNARLAITEGEAAPLLQMDKKGNTLISEYLEELISSAEQNTIVPNTDMQSVCPMFFDPGKDPVIPYLSLNKEKAEVEVKGLTLFQDDKMTGVINSDDSTLLLILLNKTKKITRLVRKVHDDKEIDVENYVTVHISKSKSKMDVTTNKSGIPEVNFDIKLKANVIEYPVDNLGDPKERKMLNKKLSKILTKDMNHMIKQLQEANSDVVGIGRELIAYHPKAWEKLEWRKVYPNISMKAKVTVEITANGIIN